MSLASNSCLALVRSCSSLRDVLVSRYHSADGEAREVVRPVEEATHRIAKKKSSTVCIMMVAVCHTDDAATRWRPVLLASGQGSRARLCEGQNRYESPDGVHNFGDRSAT